MCLRASGLLNEFLIVESLMCTAEGKLPPQIEPSIGTKQSRCLSRCHSSSHNVPKTKINSGAVEEGNSIQFDSLFSLVLLKVDVKERITER